MLLPRVGEAAERKEFVQNSFTPALDAYQHGRFNQARWNHVLGGTTVVAGLAASAVATAGVADTAVGRIAVAVFGVAASASGAIIQLVRPGRRAVAYRRAAMELEREGWYFALSHPPYDGTADANWNLSCPA